MFSGTVPEPSRITPQLTGAHNGHQTSVKGTQKDRSRTSLSPRYLYPKYVVNASAFNAQASSTSFGYPVIPPRFVDHLPEMFVFQSVPQSPSASGHGPDRSRSARTLRRPTYRCCSSVRVYLYLSKLGCLFGLLKDIRRLETVHGSTRPQYMAG